MKNRGDQPGEVVVIEAGDGIAEVDGDPVGEAGRQQESTPFAAGARKAPRWPGR